MKRIGLLGGSFNPAHSGHRHISLEAMRLLALDEVWWLVSPQNPLKTAAGMAPLAARLASARRVARHPRIRPSANGKDLVMGDRPAILVIACGALAHEIVALRRINNWPHMVVQCLPAELHNRPEKIPAAVKAKIEAIVSKKRSSQRKLTDSGMSLY